MLAKCNFCDYTSTLSRTTEKTSIKSHIITCQQFQSMSPETEAEVGLTYFHKFIQSDKAPSENTEDEGEAGLECLNKLVHENTENKSGNNTPMNQIKTKQFQNKSFRDFKNMDNDYFKIYNIFNNFLVTALKKCDSDAFKIDEDPKGFDNESMDKYLLLKTKYDFLKRKVTFVTGTLSKIISKDIGSRDGSDFEESNVQSINNEERTEPTKDAWTMSDIKTANLEETMEEVTFAPTMSNEPEKSSDPVDYSEIVDGIIDEHLLRVQSANEEVKSVNYRRTDDNGKLSTDNQDGAILYSSVDSNGKDLTSINKSCNEITDSEQAELEILLDKAELDIKTSTAEHANNKIGDDFEKIVHNVKLNDEKNDGKKHSRACVAKKKKAKKKEAQNSQWKLKEGLPHGWKARKTGNRDGIEEFRTPNGIPFKSRDTVLKYLINNHNTLDVIRNFKKHFPARNQQYFESDTLKSMMTSSKIDIGQHSNELSTDIVSNVTDQFKGILSLQQYAESLHNRNDFEVMYKMEHNPEKIDKGFRTF